MLKGAFNNDIFILTKSNNRYLTLAYSKTKTIYSVCILLTLLQNVVRTKEARSETNEKDHLVQTVSHYSGAYNIK